MSSLNSLNVLNTLTIHGALTLAGGSLGCTSGTAGSIDNACIQASAGSTLVLPSAVTSYTLNRNDGNAYTLCSATGAGTALDLSACSR